MTTQIPNDSGSLSRRSFLVAGGTVALAATAGCTGIIDFFGDRLLEEVNVFNESNQPVAGSVVVADPDGDTVLDDVFDLAASDNEDSGSESGSDNGSTTGDDQSAAVYDDVWTRSGSYEVTVEIDNAEIDGQSQANGTVTIDNPDEQMLAVVLGSAELDEPIGFRVGESLSDFAD